MGFESSTSIDDGQWHHIAGTKDGNAYSVFVDGILENSGTDDYPINSSTPLHIAHHGAWSNYFSGCIDYVRISDCIRYTQDFIPDLYQIDSNTLGLWKFNEGFGQSTVDVSGNDFHGTLQGNVVWVSGIVDGIDWLSLSPIEETILPGQSCPVTVTINAIELPPACYSVFALIESNDLNNPAIRLPVFVEVNGIPDILVTPDSLDFGRCYVGVAYQDSIIVHNNGNDTLEVADITTSAESIAVYPTAFVLPPNSSQITYVIFEEEIEAEITEAIQIFSTDPDQPVVTVIATASVRSSSLEISSDSLTAFLGLDDSTYTNFVLLNTSDDVSLEYSLSIEYGSSTRTLSLQPVETGLNESSYGTGSRRLEIDPDQFTYIGALEGHEYYLSTYETDWFSALGACESQEGHLVTIKDQQENDLVSSSSSSGKWIGFTDEVVEGDWTWISSESVTFTNWYPGEPNNGNGDQHYGVMWELWDDRAGQQEFYFVLEIELYTPWLSLLPTSGILEPSQTDAVLVSLFSSDLEEGMHNATIHIQTDDPGLPVFALPVQLTVDLSPPFIVSGVTCQPSDTEIAVSWNQSNAGDIDIYSIYRGVSPEMLNVISSTSHSNTSFVDTFLPDETLVYFYSVTAIDTLGNESGLSEIVSTYLDIPSAIRDLSISLSGNSVRLEWTSVDTTVYGHPIQNLQGYLIYISGTPYLEDFSYFAFTSDTTYLHFNAIPFTDSNFYRVAAYVGSLRLLDTIIAEEPDVKMGKLNELLERQMLDNSPFRLNERK